MLRFKCRDGNITNRMKVTRSVQQSYSTIVGMATGELNLERSGKVTGVGSLCAGIGLKSGV